MAKKKFGKMSPAEQRVAIAKDALSWVEVGALVAEQCVYVRAEQRPYALPGVQLRDVNLGKCHVCALGALFLAKANRFDNVGAGVNFYGDVLRSSLGEHFSIGQLGLVEAAFEMHANFATKHGVGSAAADTAVRFGQKRTTDRSRMSAILRNIVENDGTFVP
jgi:hypothetical protein